MNVFSGDSDLALADAWQHDFPLESRPFASIGASRGLTEDEALDALTRLTARGVLSRIGPVIRPNTVGASTLAAMAVPPERLETVAMRVNEHSVVNHNYERENHFNLWFVVAAENRQRVLATLDQISQAAGLPVLNLPLERAYHIDLGFSIGTVGHKDGMRGDIEITPVIDAEDRMILAQLEEGLPLASRPYELLATYLGITEAQMCARLQRLLDCGVISRFGCILMHRRLGFTSNAMAVWDVPDETVDAVGETLAGEAEVTLCYRRRRRLPHWPYNLYAMVHGRERRRVQKRLHAINREVGIEALPHAVLFSRRCFKQNGARYGRRPEEAK